ncbi:MAG: metallopeptidase TldD-related protein [Anaplasmataceae bacterium]|nr:metallopeptidase TldD-related protein [Anaplasmataceae bacterium]
MNYSRHKDKLSHELYNILSLADGGELFIEDKDAETITLENGIIKNLISNKKKGFGLRVFYKNKVIFVHSDSVTQDAINKATKTITDYKLYNKNGIASINDDTMKGIFYDYTTHTNTDLKSKIAKLQEIHQYIKGKESRITQVTINYNSYVQDVDIIKSESEQYYDVRPMTTLSIQVVAKEGDRVETGHAGHGGRGDNKYYLDSWQKIADKAIENAIRSLGAMDAPAGEMPIILGHGITGVLLHEAIGHGLEADFNRKGSSAFSKLLYKKVANDNVTILDDGTVANSRGSLNIDDEGNKTQQNVLVKDGILVKYMQDAMNANLMGMEVTGNGRRESYQHLVMPRMTNTYMLNGNDTVDKMISSVENGIYAVSFAGGQVEITSGKFVFHAAEAYLVKNGKIVNPIRGAILVGDGLTVLKEISMVANDLELDAGTGTCGKDGQWVPVGTGQPSVLINKLVVGGTKT